MTPAELGQKVKAKYPQYQSLDDSELGHKVATKYPQYQAMLTESTLPKQDNRSRDMALQAVFPGAAAIKPAMDVAKGYGQLRESISEPLSHIVHEGGPKHQVTVPISPGINIPAGQYTGREAMKEVAGMGVDQLATLGLGKLAPALFRGAKKVASIPGKIERAVGSEITPKALEAATGRVRAMEPEALGAIGVKPEDISTVSNLKKEYGFKEFPTKEDANKFFGKVTSQPINTESGNVVPESFVPKIKETISSLSSGLGKNPRLANELQTILDDISRGKTIDKATYEATRLNLNNMASGNPEIDRFIGPVKEALDFDAAQSGITGIGKARATYQLAHTPKIENYLSDTKLPIKIQNLLESAQKPGEVTIKEQLKALLGDKSEGILKDLEKNRKQLNRVKGVKTVAKYGAGYGLIDYLLRRILGRSVLDVIGGGK